MSVYHIGDSKSYVNISRLMRKTAWSFKICILQLLLAFDRHYFCRLNRANAKYILDQ